MKKFFANKYFLQGLALSAMIFGFMAVSTITGARPEQTSAACDGICVSIGPDGMQPEELAVKTGEFVQFNTADGKKHNLSLGDGQEAKSHGHDSRAHDHDEGFESGEFGAGEAWRAQFKKPGTYLIHDHNNPTNRILIVVYTPSI